MAGGILSEEKIPFSRFPRHSGKLEHCHFSQPVSMTQCEVACLLGIKFLTHSPRLFKRITDSMLFEEKVPSFLGKT